MNRLKVSEHDAILAPCCCLPIQQDLKKVAPTLKIHTPLHLVYLQQGNHQVLHEEILRMGNYASMPQKRNRRHCSLTLTNTDCILMVEQAEENEQYKVERQVKETILGGSKFD